MHWQSVSASLLGGLRFRAAPWWLAAPGAADAISAGKKPHGGALGRPKTLPSTRSSRDPRHG